MTDQFHDSTPAVGNTVAADIPDIAESLGHLKDSFQNFCATWSDTDATALFPYKIKRVAKTADYTMVAGDRYVEIDPAAATAFTLLSAATVGEHTVCTVKAIDVDNSVTITPDGAETIEGRTTYVFFVDGQTVTIISDGTNWKILDEYIPVYKDITEVSSSGTGEDDLMTMTLYGNVLGTAGGLHIKTSGTKTNANATAALKLYLGSTAVFSFTAGSAVRDWVIDVVIMNDGATDAQKVQSMVMSKDQAYQADYATASEDTTGDLTVKMTAECGNASDVMTQQMLTIEKI